MAAQNLDEIVWIVVNFILLDLQIVVEFNNANILQLVRLMVTPRTS